MEAYKKYIENNIENINIDKLKEIIRWIQLEYPDFEIMIKWNQPMYVYKETFIVGFSLAKNHITVAFEKVVFNEFLDELKKMYDTNKGTYKVKKEERFDKDLLKRMIEHTLVIKEGHNKFWL